MSEFLRSFLTAVIFVAAGGLLAAALLGLGSLLRPVRPTVQKRMVYESGVDPVGDGWSQSQIRYYVFALLFVIFDVEAVFIFPWAVRLEAYAGFGLVEMGVFLFVLVLGLVYAWRKGVLRWV
jgi:NADH-quinone oxidoreductase subunit A